MRNLAVAIVVLLLSGCITSKGTLNFPPFGSMGIETEEPLPPDVGSEIYVTIKASQESRA